MNMEKKINKIIGNSDVSREVHKLKKSNWFEIVDKKTQKSLGTIPAKTKDAAVKEFIKRSGGYKGTITIYPVEYR